MMVVGIDFHKDTASPKRCCAFVASMNGNESSKLNCTRYFSRCITEDLGQEFSNGLRQFMLGKITTINYIRISFIQKETSFEFLRCTQKIPRKK